MRAALSPAPDPAARPALAHLCLVDGVAFLLVLQRGAELGFALIDPGDQVVAAGRQGAGWGRGRDVNGPVGTDGGVCGLLEIPLRDLSRGKSHVQGSEKRWKVRESSSGVRWMAECCIPRPPSIQVLSGTLWPGVSLPPDPAQPHLRATLRDLGPWYLVLTASAFSRKRSDRSYSITPCSTSPMLFWGQSGGPWSAPTPLGWRLVPLPLPSTHVQQRHLRVVLPEHEQCEVAGAVQQAQGGGQLATGETVERQVHLPGQSSRVTAAAGPVPRAGPAPAPGGDSRIPGWCWGARCPSLARSLARPSADY